MKQDYRESRENQNGPEADISPFPAATSTTGSPNPSRREVKAWCQSETQPTSLSLSGQRVALGFLYLASMVWLPQPSWFAHGAVAVGWMPVTKDHTCPKWYLKVQSLHLLSSHKEKAEEKMWSYNPASSTGIGLSKCWVIALLCSSEKGCSTNEPAWWTSKKSEPQKCTNCMFPFQKGQTQAKPKISCLGIFTR